MSTMWSKGTDRCSAKAVCFDGWIKIGTVFISTSSLQSNLLRIRLWSEWNYQEKKSVREKVRWIASWFRNYEFNKQWLMASGSCPGWVISLIHPTQWSQPAISQHLIHGAWWETPSSCFVYHILLWIVSFMKTVEHPWLSWSNKS